MKGKSEKKPTISKKKLRQEIKDFSLKLGFDLVGFTKAKVEEKYLSEFKRWLDSGNHGEMKYMEEFQKRADLTRVLPGAKSVVCLAMNYYYEQEDLKPGFGRIARYAYGRDYHKIIGKKLKKLREFIGELAVKAGLECECRSYVDTGPVLERALAEQAGIGIVGKNTLLITRKFGSWVFLAEIITTLDLLDGNNGKSSDNSDCGNLNSKENLENSDGEMDPENVFKIRSKNDFGICGNCRKCIDACPTGAIIAPGVIDARRCISYLTIENREQIPKEFAKVIAKTKRIYGCDICQEVCPHNQVHQKPHNHPEFGDPKIAGDQLNLKEIQKIKTAQGYLDKFAGSALMRVKKEGLHRNAQAGEAGAK